MLTVVVQVPAAAQVALAEETEVQTITQEVPAQVVKVIQAALEETTVAVVAVRLAQAELLKPRVMLAQEALEEHHLLQVHL